MTMPALGEPFAAEVPQNSHASVTIAVIDRTSGLFTPQQLSNLVWCLRYQLLFHYNRSPWVERDYSAPCDDVLLVAVGSPIPAGASVIELLDEASQPGALGWHEDRSVQSTAHSARGVKLHAGAEVPWAVVGVKTSRADLVQPSEVVSHEALEFLVDPWVMNESDLRVYSNPADGKEYIGEVGDPVQDRGYDVGAPDGRSCGVPEAVVADFAYPRWWAQPQRRAACSFCEDGESWKGAPPRSGLTAFQLAPGGYMSVRPPGGEWTQIWGSDRPRAEANARAYERPGDVG